MFAVKLRITKQIFDFKKIVFAKHFFSQREIRSEKKNHKIQKHAAITN